MSAAERLSLTDLATRFPILPAVLADALDDQYMADYRAAVNPTTPDLPTTER